MLFHFCNRFCITLEPAPKDGQSSRSGSRDGLQENLTGARSLITRYWGQPRITAVISASDLRVV